MELEREIVIDATPETVFELLTVPERHTAWEGTEVELDPRPGGIYRVLVAGEYQAAGNFVEVVPNEKVVFTFGWEMEGNPIVPGSTTVEYTLIPEGNKTRLVVTFRGREMAHPGIGHALLKRLANELADLALVEQPATPDGKRLMLVLAPRGGVVRPMSTPAPAGPTPTPSSPGGDGTPPIALPGQASAVARPAAPTAQSAPRGPGGPLRR